MDSTMTGTSHQNEDKKNDGSMNNAAMNDMNVNVDM